MSHFSQFKRAEADILSPKENLGNTQLNKIEFSLICNANLKMINMAVIHV